MAGTLLTNRYKIIGRIDKRRMGKIVVYVMQKERRRFKIDEFDRRENC